MAGAMEDNWLERLHEETLGLLQPFDPSVDGIIRLPPALRHFSLWILRCGHATIEQMAEFLTSPQEEVRTLVEKLSHFGIMEHVPTCGVPVYRICLVPRTLRPPQVLMDMFAELTPSNGPP